MQILKQLTIKNFLNTSYREVNFEKTKDITLIIGGNTKGKTTILRAIYMCLTGQDAFFGNRNIDYLIQNGQGKMELELSLARGGNEYVIKISKQRGEKKNLVISIVENGVNLNTSNLITEAKEILTDLFGDPISILNTYFFFSNHEEDFVTATPAKRLEMITQNSAIFAEYNNISSQASLFAKELNQEADVYKGRISAQEEALINKEQEFYKAEESLKDLTGQSNYNKTTIDGIIKDIDTDINRNKETLQKIANLEKLQKEISEISNTNIEVLQKQMKEDKVAQSFNEKIVAKIEKLQKEKETENRQYNEFTRRVSAITIDINNRNNSIKLEKVKYVELSEDLVYIKEADIPKAKTELEALIKEKEELTNTGKELATRINIKTKELEDLNKLFEHNKVCPVCKSTLTEKALKAYEKEILAEIKEYEEKKAEKTAEFIALSTKIKEKTSAIENSEQKIKNDNIEKNIKLIGKELAVFEKKKAEAEKGLEAAKESLEEISNKEKELRSQTKPRLSHKEIEQMEAKISAYNSMVSKIEERDALLVECEGEDKEELLEENAELTKKKEDINLAVFSYNNTLKNCEELTATITESKKKLETLNIDIVQYKNISKWYGKNGIQKKQVELILKNVEFETNAAISKFFNNIIINFGFDGNGISLSVVRQYINEQGGIEYIEDTIKNFSDAQQEILRVILKVFLSKASQYMEKRPLNMLFFNETFNKLSEDKEIELKKILEFFAREHQVVFVTHNKNILSYFEEENIVEL